MSEYTLKASESLILKGTDGPAPSTFLFSVKSGTGKVRASVKDPPATQECELTSSSSPSKVKFQAWGSEILLENYGKVTVTISTDLQAP